MSSGGDRYFKGRAHRRRILGAKVDTAIIDTPNGGSTALFNIIGGRVILTSIVGEVTTGIESATSELQLTANPTVAGSSLVICAVLNCNADEVGTLYGITGTFGDALIGTNAGATIIPSARPVLAIGTLDATMSQSTDGAIKWSATYIPLDPSAEMTVA